MRIVRTFHPVGQGAFYSERFYDDNHQDAIHNIVYDCGTLLGYIRKAKKVVSQAFDKKDVIDYLFISHLDYDHISLVETLLSSVRGVKNIVLPLIALDELQVVMAYQQMSENSVETVSFLQRIINHMKGQSRNDYWDGEYRVLFVRDEETDNVEVGNAGYWINGSQHQTSLLPDWVLVPYNTHYRSRRLELIKKLDGVIKKTEFIEELRLIGETTIKNGEFLYEKLRDESFVTKVITNTVLKNAIKSAYEKLPGGINDNSLLLYSGPTPEVDSYKQMDYCPCYPSCWHRYHEPGCLYTGDSICNIQKWKNAVFYDVWNNIGTIQLPHHGSLESFDVTKNTIDKQYVFPVSFGSKNSFGHPSGKVISFLLAQDCIPVMVSEMANTAYYQKIYRRV